MGERIVKVVPVRVHMDCNQTLCDGEMIATGSALLSSPPRYEHECNVCGNLEVYRGRSYPYIDYREIPRSVNQGEY